jgi:hypothetical protein
MTIDELMSALQKMRDESPLGGETVALVCIPMLEYQPIIGTCLEASSDGAVALLDIEDVV